MYKAIQSKNYYLVFHKFNPKAKTLKGITAYSNGFRQWDSPEMKTFAIVLGVYRIMFGIKKEQFGSCG